MNINQRIVENKDDETTSTMYSVHCTHTSQPQFSSGFGKSKDETILYNVYGGNHSAMQNTDKEIYEFLQAGAKKYVLEHTALQNELEKFLAELMLAHNEMGDEAVLDIMRKYDILRPNWPEAVIKWNNILEALLRNGYLPDYDDPAKKTEREDKMTILRTKQIWQGMTTTIPSSTLKQSVLSNRSSSHPQQINASDTHDCLETSFEVKNVEAALLQQYMKTTKESTQHADQIGRGVASALMSQSSSTSEENKSLTMMDMQKQAYLDDELSKLISKTNEAIEIKILPTLNQREKDIDTHVEQQNQKKNEQSSSRISQETSHTASGEESSLALLAHTMSKDSVNSRPKLRLGSTGFSYDPATRQQEVMNNYPYKMTGQNSNSTYAQKDVDPASCLNLQGKLSRNDQHITDQTANQQFTNEQYLELRRIEQLARGAGTQLGKAKFESYLDEDDRKRKNEKEQQEKKKSGKRTLSSDDDELTQNQSKISGNKSLRERCMRKPDCGNGRRATET